MSALCRVTYTRKSRKRRALNTSAQGNAPEWYTLMRYPPMASCRPPVSPINSAISSPTSSVGLVIGGTLSLAAAMRPPERVAMAQLDGLLAGFARADADDL